MGRTCSKNGKDMLLMRKPEGKRPLERPRCRWVNNIKIGLGDVGWGAMPQDGDQ
jgi:hypothetical protein